MPNYDGTGPFGDGRPGRGLGPCGRYGAPSRGIFGLRLGRGFRRGFGRGRGFGFRGGYGPRFGRFYDGPVNDPQKPVYTYTREDLLAQKKDLERQLHWLDEQLSKEDTE